MELKKSRVLFISQYSAPYKGKFVASFEALEQKLITEYDCVAVPSTILFKSESVADLAECMLRMYNANTEELKSKCENSKQNNIEKYGIDVWTTNMIDFYKAIK